MFRYTTRLKMPLALSNSHLFLRDRIVRAPATDTCPNDTLTIAIMQLEKCFQRYDDSHNVCRELVRIYNEVWVDPRSLKGMISCLYHCTHKALLPIRRASMDLAGPEQLTAAQGAGSCGGMPQLRQKRSPQEHCTSTACLRHDAAALLSSGGTSRATQLPQPGLGHLHRCSKPASHVLRAKYQMQH